MPEIASKIATTSPPVKNKGGRPKNCPACKRPKTMCLCGRPRVIDDKVLEKLENAFALGLNKTAACTRAGISRSTLKRYMNENPKFRTRIKELQENPSTLAHVRVVKAIQEGDVALAKWWLERRKKKEFGNAIDVSGIEQPPVALVRFIKSNGGKKRKNSKRKRT